MSLSCLSLIRSSFQVLFHHSVSLFSFSCHLGESGVSCVNTVFGREALSIVEQVTQTNAKAFGTVYPTATILVKVLACFLLGLGCFLSGFWWFVVPTTTPAINPTNSMGFGLDLTLVKGRFSVGFGVRLVFT